MVGLMMMTIASLMMIPLIGAVMMYVGRKNPNRRDSLGFITALLLVVIVARVLFSQVDGASDPIHIWSFFPGVSLSFFMDPLSVLFAFVASFLWVFTSMYAVGYMRGAGEGQQTRFFICFALSISATMGVAFSANLFTLYLFYELLSISTYALVGHHQNHDAKIGARKYVIFLFGGSIGLVLPAMILIYHMAGTLDFSYMGILTASADPTVLVAIMLMTLYGFGKAGLMPFHAWLPGAMVAPTPVSALLHAVAVVKVGVFSIVRVITGIYGYELIQIANLSYLICYVAAFTVITASVIALYQDSLKRRLAFSTVGQLAYIIMGVGLATPLGFTGGVLHIVMHAFGKITLFFCAGAIYVATKKKNVSQLDGIGRSMPWTMGAFFVGALCVIGLPPTGGFVSKWMMLMGAMDAEMIMIMVVYLVSSCLNASYFLPIIYRAFFRVPTDSAQSGIKEAPLFCVIPPVVTAAMSVALFFMYPIFSSMIGSVFYE